MNQSRRCFSRAREFARLGLAVLLALTLSPAVAFAHAKLLRSEPKADSIVTQPPKLVELWFTEALKPGFNTIEVTIAGGQRIDHGEVTLSEGDKRAQVELADTGGGAYTVVWKILSADEHAIRGKFTFNIAAPAGTTTAATPGPTAATSPHGDHSGTAITGEDHASLATGAEDTPITWVDSIVRWLSYLSMMTLLGGFASHLLVLDPALRNIRDEDEAHRESAVLASTRRTIKLFWAGLVMLFPMLVTALILQTSAVNGIRLGAAISPTLLGRVITQTGFGTAWLITTSAAIALGGIVFLLYGRFSGAQPARENKAWWWAGLAVSGLMLFGPSLTGHAMAAASEYQLAVVSDWLHLVAGGFWVGSLFHLAIAVPAGLRELTPHRRTRSLGRIITLFTRVAIPSVAVVFLAGLYNSWLHVGSFGALWSTGYGRTLLLKLAIILPMLVLGALNGFRYGPRAGRLADSDDDVGRKEVERGFARSLKIEASLGVLVLLVAAFLVFATPSRNEAMDAASGEPPPESQPQN